MADQELAQYYIIKFEKFMDMIKQIDSLYNIISALIKEHVPKNVIEVWDTTPIPELSGYFAALHELKNFLDDVINNPTEEEIQFMIKNEIKDVLVSLEDLNAMNIMFGAVEEFSIRLYENHGIVTNIH